MPLPAVFLSKLSDKNFEKAILLKKVKLISKFRLIIHERWAKIKTCINSKMFRD